MTATWTPPPGAPGTAAPADGAAEPPRLPAEITFPDQGAGTWQLASEPSIVAGAAGNLLRYHVAVERGIANVGAEEFAAAVTGTLSDPRSWIGNGDIRLQRVGGGEAADFVIYLATPVTRDRLCGSSYDRYTSCRNGDTVVINVARWVNGASAVGGTLAAYRDYVVNHEVGHRLGHGHQLCPGPGAAAPVMQQQTLGLHGCRPNAWPVPDGAMYRGPAGEYDDAPPSS
ncbi:MAG TPA: DUF3152 domain-containing protein [Micromonosporaceae bacterium]|nr:DUF3152 domain-containing protein [Micromonosporaceae bacterium]